jgi:ATP-binding cassette, subfamily B, bacterial CvaB/MchF/RaxB
MLQFRLFKRRRLPIILQTEFAECGMACIAMIAAWHGIYFDMVDLRLKFPLSNRGTTFRDLLRIASELKFNARPLKASIEALQQIELPAILHWNMSHFVVLKSIRGQKYTIADPAIGEYIVGLDEFSKGYTGVCLELTPSINILAEPTIPRERLSFSFLKNIVGIKATASHLVFLGVIIQIVGLIPPYYLQWVLDGATVSNDADLVGILGLVAAGLVIFQTGLGVVRTWTVTTVATQIKFYWYSSVFRHLIRLPLSFFSARSLGDILSRFGAIEQLQQTITTQLVESAIDGLLSTIVIGLMIYYSPKLTLASMFATAAYAVLRCGLRGPLDAAIRAQLVSSAKQQAHFLETVRSISAIRMFGKVLSRQAIWSDRLVEQFNHDLDVSRIQLGIHSGNALIFGLERILLIWLGALAVMQGELSIGALVAFLAYKDQFTTRVSKLIDAWLEIRLLSPQVDRLGDILRTRPEDDNDTASAFKVSNSPVLKLSGIHFGYSSNESEVLSGIDLEVPFGQSVCITGESGSGKTTLIQIIMGIYDPTQGEILIDGVNIKKYGIQRYRSLFGVVMQDDNLLSGTIAQNIAFFEDNTDEDRMIGCASLAGIHDDILAMPMGYRTLIGDLGAGLSGGQLQRLFIARALYNRPKILLLDEATSHLDIKNEVLVAANIARLEVTRVCIAHRPETIRLADRIIEIRNGIIVRDEFQVPTNALLSSGTS